MHDTVADRVRRRDVAEHGEPLAVQLLFTLCQQCVAMPSQLNAASFSDEEPALMA